jgi:DNA invertase Pin-like site-specific DNA recombinase
MLIGYARVSTTEQTLALQQDALTNAGCERIFTDTASGGQTDRPGLTEALSHLQTGDTLVVWKIFGVLQAADDKQYSESRCQSRV